MTNTKSELPDNLYTTSAVRELDRLAIDEENITGLELMERAGQAAFELMRNLWPQAHNIVVLCGTGNNGGDGYILARLSKESGMQVRVIQLGDLSTVTGDALTAASACHASGVASEVYDASILRGAELCVDALLGTGIDRAPRDLWQLAISNLNASAKPIFSLDVPSGLSGDSGHCKGVAVNANATITFIGVKQGLLTAQGPVQCGELFFSDLAVAKAIFEQVPTSTKRISLKKLKAFLPRRNRDTHKGHCGHVVVIGGDYGYAGAVRIAAEAAARVGAGLVSVATRPEHALNIPLARPELMTIAISSGDDLTAILNKASVLVIGPGLGQSDWAFALMAKVLETKLPMVIDADALNLLSLEPSISARWVLTPHPGEAARLLSCSSEEIQADRFAAGRAIQSRFGGVCILKGSGTLIVDNEQSISLCTAGNPGMASGGMGDALSGVIAGLMAQGLDKADAARVGACLHSSAADEAAASGERGMLASDLMPVLRSLANPTNYAN